MEISTLPNGVWYEAPKRRYRVRRYHNNVIYGPYYYRTLEQALARLEELNEKLAQIPRTPRQRRKKLEGE